MAKTKKTTKTKKVKTVVKPQDFSAQPKGSLKKALQLKRAGKFATVHSALSSIKSL